MITDQQLRAFIKVAEFNLTSLSAAAKRLNITPQALGKTIMNLEEELGTSLFVRSTSRFSLTNVGALLLPHAQNLYGGKQAFLQNVQKICEKARGHIYLASENGVVVSTLSPEAALLSEIYFGSNLDTCVDRLNKGLADLIYSRYYPETDVKLDYIPVVRQNIQVLMSKSHALAEKEKLSLEDLRGQNILLLPRILFPGSLTRLCLRRGFNPALIECVSAVILISLLKQGAGIALYPPAVLAEYDLGGLLYKPIEMGSGEEECQIGFYAKEGWESNARLKYIIQKTLDFQNSRLSEHTSPVPRGDPRSPAGKKKREAAVMQTPRITERQMRIVVCAAKMRSLSNAAGSLFISEQADSKGLFAREEELGVELFHRLPRQMKPTEVGNELLPLFQQMLEELDTWYEFAGKLCGERQEKIIVAMETRSMQITFPFYQPTQMMATVSAVPCESIDECLALLKGGRCDIIYCLDKREVPDCRYIPVLNIQPVVLMHRNHPLAGRRTLSIADLKNESFAVFEPSDPFNLRLQEVCELNGFTPDTAAESFNEGLLVRLVRANRCIMVLPPHFLSAMSMEALTAVPLQEPGFLYSTGLLIDRNRKPSPAMKQFIRYILKQHNAAVSGADSAGT